MQFAFFSRVLVQNKKQDKAGKMIEGFQLNEGLGRAFVMNEVKQ